MLVQRSPCYFVHIFAVGDRWLLRSVLVSLLLTEDGLDFFVKVLTSMTHEQNLQGLLDSDPSLEVLIVHQERDQVVELSWLEIAWVRDATLVHRLELLLADETVQVVIDLPNDELDVGARRTAPEELKCASDVHRTDLIVVLLLGSVTTAQELEHSVKLFLLNGLNLDRLENLSWTRL